MKPNRKSVTAVVEKYDSWENYYSGANKEILDAQKKMVSTSAYILDADECDTAPYWYVRHGMEDRDTSFATITALFLALENADDPIADANLSFVWGREHEGYYDALEAWAWVKSIVPDVVVTNQKLTVNGEAKKVEVYNINGNNYFKLRDIAYLLAGSEAEFGVEFDNSKKEVYIDTVGEYEAVGSELNEGTDKSDTCVITAFDIYVDGKLVDVVVYNIGGNNYFKLRDLGKAIGFGVDYDDATRTVLITSN